MSGMPSEKSIARLNPLILIIDDDRGHLAMLGKRLGEQGLDILTADQADLGLQTAMHRNPDLIILDVMMPVINGFNVCRLLKNEDTTKMIPVILLTSRDEDRDRQFGTEAGADAYLTKPVDVDILLRQIHLLLSAGQRNSSEGI